jgi:hypothetical protein
MPDARYPQSRIADVAVDLHGDELPSHPAQCAA